MCFIGIPTYRGQKISNRLWGWASKKGRTQRHKGVKGIIEAGLNGAGWKGRVEKGTLGGVNKAKDISKKSHGNLYYGRNLCVCVCTHTY